MATFLDKKEQVIDLKLTSYGHYLLSIGNFKPAFYSFYDDNVMYDKKYAHPTTTENQNNIDSRIKKDTQYIESMVLFRDVEDTLNNGNAVPQENFGPAMTIFQDLQTPRQRTPAKDIFKLDAPIGDALIEGDTNKAPAWKIVSLQSIIDSVAQTDDTNNSIIPQLNITSTYFKKAVDIEDGVQSVTNGREDLRSSVNRTPEFIDGKIIILESSDPLYYIEELNTQLLTKNFDIEVFEVLTSSNEGSYEQLQKKYFKSKIPQVQNGFLVSESPMDTPEQEMTNNDVEYYFNILLDSEVNQQLACRAASFFNKKSYYVDLDFDCSEEAQENIFYDIYGSVTEPEICLD